MICLKMQDYLFRLLKGVVKKRIKLQCISEIFMGKDQENYVKYIIQEKLLVKILNERFGLNVDTTLIAMNIKRKLLLRKAGILNG